MLRHYIETMKQYGILQQFRKWPSVLFVSLTVRSQKVRLSLQELIPVCTGEAISRHLIVVFLIL